MSYNQALMRGKQSGAGRAGDEEFLAMLCESLASLHAINPAMVFEGAQKRGLTANEVATLAEHNPAALGDLMFV